MAKHAAPDVLAQLTAGIAALTSSAAWREWLAAQSRFHPYSFGNVLLIHPSAPRRPGSRVSHLAG